MAELKEEGTKELFGKKTDKEKMKRLEEEFDRVVPKQRYMNLKSD